MKPQILTDIENNKDEITNLQTDLTTHKNDYANHLSATMPHQARDLELNKTYKFGLQLSAEGNPQIIFEEVI